MLQIISIDGQLTQAYSLTVSNATYVLKRGSSITTNSVDTLFQADGVVANNLVVKGHITGGTGDSDTGVHFSGDGSEINIAKSGVIEASIGMAIGGGDQRVFNHGTIDAGRFGVWLQNNGAVTNFGHISGDQNGIVSGGLHSISIVNGEGGHITSKAVAVQFNGAVDTASTLTNDGVLRGTWAFSAAGGDDTVVNHGQMNGLISMGEGDDTFDNRGGKVDNDIFGQEGYDTLITDDANVHLREDADQGTDTVKSTVTYALNANVENLILLGKADTNGTGTKASNEITGNRGDNTLKGLGGIDILNGGRGDDVLKGGAGGDTFMFAKHGGHDVISDFTSGIDHVNLVGQKAIHDFDDMINNHVSSSHGDLVIHMGHDTLTLRNTDVGDLATSDFIF